MTAPEAPGSLVQSVDRALTMLELLGADGRLGVTEIAGLLDVHKSTASRLLATLEAHGLVEQLPDRGRYQLGVGVLRLAAATRGRLDLVDQSRPVTSALAVAVDETINVVIMSGREALYLDQIAGSSALQIHNWIGRRNPLHATANGRVLLGHLPEPERDAIIAAALGADGRLPQLTEHTVVEVAALRTELEQVRVRGHAVVSDELEVGLTAVAAPIRGSAGDVIASLSASGPTFRIAHRLPEIVAAVGAAADEVSQRMGYLAGTSREGSKSAVVNAG